MSNLIWILILSTNTYAACPTTLVAGQTVRFIDPFLSYCTGVIVNQIEVSGDRFVYNVLATCIKGETQIQINVVRFPEELIQISENDKL